MNHFLDRIKAKRTSNLISTAIILAITVIATVFEHGLLSLLEEHVAAHPGFISDVLSHIVPWLIEHPYTLILLVFLVVWFNSFVLHGHSPDDGSASLVLASSTATANPTITTSPTFNAHPQATANPHIEVKPEFHFYPPQAQPKDFEPIQRSAPESAPHRLSHNITFTGGERYDPNKHGSFGDGIHCDKIRMVLAGFRNKHIVGSTVAHVRDVQAGITYKGEHGAELLYMHPGEWFNHDANAVKLESGGMSEFVVLAIYNYSDQQWETRKMTRRKSFDMDYFQCESRPLPFGNYTADIVLLEKDGSALEGGTVSFELRENGEFSLVPANPVHIPSATLDAPLVSSATSRNPIALRGVSVIRTDTIHEYHPPEAQGAVAVKACFMNRRVAGQPPSQFTYVTTNVTYRDSRNLEVAYTDSPKWLRHDLDDSVSIAPNTSECLILAVYDRSDGRWVLPFLKRITLDDGLHGNELDLIPLPFGNLSVEINLSSEDYAGLPRFVLQLNLSPDANVRVIEG